MEAREAEYDSRELELEAGGETCFRAASVAPHNTAAETIRPAVRRSVPPPLRIASLKNRKIVFKIIAMIL